MDNKTPILNAVNSTVFIFFINELNLIGICIILLILLMCIDYFSGLLAARKEALENPDNPAYGWSSKKSILGIYKKIGYFLTILVAISTDYLIYTFGHELGLIYPKGAYIGSVVVIWLTINELISILENAERMGVELPPLIKRILTESKAKLNDRH
ncbi:phage holin family protein [Pseudobutyrivibrio sp.]|jgi:toxin secretion/phage lysis holin|uniref:phage holin family protein n=1 Tax=Pseudobutyrivibrio sp. TaxID=2014367 RepID=UPI0025DD3CCD|nr:phage holin family protein [Pseudobutyrivibrio sp.]